MKTKLIWWAALVVSTVGLSGCVNREAQKVAKETQTFVQDKTTPVKTQTPVIKSIASELEISGSMVSSDDTSVGAQLAGRLVAVYVKDGDHVSAGQVIARQDVSDLNARVRQAQAQLSQANAAYAAAKADQNIGPDRASTAVKSAQARLAAARATLAKLRAGDRPEQRKAVAAQVAGAKSNLAVAKKDLDRYRTLFADGAVSQADVDVKDNAYQQALSQYEQALESQRMQQVGSRPEDIRASENDVRAAEQAVNDAQASKRNDVQFNYRSEQALSNVQSAEEALAIARKALGDAEIRAPFSGTVSGKPLAPGTFVGAGTAVARIIGGDGVYLEADVPESKLEGIQEGAQVEIRMDAFPGQVFSGIVKAVNPQASETSRLFKVRVALQGSAAAVKPGMFAKGRIQTKVVPDAVVLPATAVLGDDTGHYVFVADGTKAKKVKVAVGIQKGAEIQVSGLDPTAKVIVDGQVGLIDGALIKEQAQGQAQAKA